MRNPELVWEWYKARKKIIASIQPNPGHVALAEMEQRFRRFTVITQNIDNLHQRAGSKKVYELHGNIERNYCTSCGKLFPDDRIMSESMIPRCGSSAGLIRPGFVCCGARLPAIQWDQSGKTAER